MSIGTDNSRNQSSGADGGQHSSHEPCLDLGDIGDTEIARRDLAKIQLRLDNPATFDAQVEACNWAVKGKGPEALWQNIYGRVPGDSDKTKIKNWEHYSTCFRQRVVAAFCEPDDFTIPLACLPKDPRDPAFQTPHSRHKALALSVPMSPSRIPEALLETLKICDFSDLKRKPGVRLERASQLSTVLSLKLVLDSSIEFERNQGRIRMIEAPDQRVRALYPEEISNPDAGLHGRFLVFSERQSGGKNGGGTPSDKKSFEANVRLLGVSFYPDLHSVHRRCVAIKLGYPAESEQITEILPGLRNCRNLLDATLRKGIGETEKKEARSNAKTLMTKAIEIVEHSLDHNKKEAREFLSSAVSFRDSRDRPNDSAAISQLSATILRFAARLKEIGDKGQYIHRDYTTTCQMLSSRNSEFKAYRVRLEKAAEGKLAPQNIHKQPPFYSSTRDLNRENRIQDLLRPLDLTPPDPSKMEAPYRQFAEKMRRYFDNLVEAITNKSTKGTHEAHVKLYIVSKYVAANEVAQAISRCLSIPSIVGSNEADAKSDWMLDPTISKRPSLQQVKTLLDQLDNLFQKDRILSGINVSRFNDPFRGLRKELREIRNEVDQEIATPGILGFANSDDLYESLKEKIGSLNIEARATELP